MNIAEKLGMHGIGGGGASLGEEFIPVVFADVQPNAVPNMLWVKYAGNPGKVYFDEFEPSNLEVGDVFIRTVDKKQVPKMAQVKKGKFISPLTPYTLPASNIPNRIFAMTALLDVYGRIGSIYVKTAQGNQYLDAHYYDGTQWRSVSSSHEHIYYIDSTNKLTKSTIDGVVVQVGTTAVTSGASILRLVSNKESNYIVGHSSQYVYVFDMETLNQLSYTRIAQNGGSGEYRYSQYISGFGFLLTGELSFLIEQTELDYTSQNETFYNVSPGGVITKVTMYHGAGKNTLWDRGGIAMFKGGSSYNSLGLRRVSHITNAETNLTPPGFPGNQLYSTSFDKDGNVYVTRSSDFRALNYNIASGIYTPTYVVSSPDNTSSVVSMANMEGDSFTFTFSTRTLHKLTKVTKDGVITSRNIIPDIVDTSGSSTHSNLFLTRDKVILVAPVSKKIVIYNQFDLTLFMIVDATNILIPSITASTERIPDFITTW